MIKSYKHNDMVIFKVHDKDDQELEMYVNDQGLVFIEIYAQDQAEYSQYVTLNKSDAQAMIENLHRLLNDYEVSE